MTPPTAAALLVFGRGVTYDAGRYVLTPASVARVRAAADYVEHHRAEYAAAADGPREEYAPTAADPAEGRRKLYAPTADRTERRSGAYAQTAGRVERRGGAHAPAAGHVDRRARGVQVIFSGGWAEASEGAVEPPAGSREGDLMVAEARSLGLHRYADLRSETRSRSTLENLLHTVEDGLLDGYAFDAGQPLGLVSHPWHLPRIRYLAGKVLGLRGSALLDVPVVGGACDTARGERMTRAAVRMFFLGAHDPAGLRRRERRMIAWLRRAERVRAAVAGRRGPQRIDRLAPMG